MRRKAFPTRELNRDVNLSRQGRLGLRLAETVISAQFEPVRGPIASLLRDLRQATLALAREAVSDIISRIADQDPVVAAGLKNFVDNFQMAESSTLLGESNDHADRA